MTILRTDPFLIDINLVSTIDLQANISDYVSLLENFADECVLNNTFWHTDSHSDPITSKIDFFTKLNNNQILLSIYIANVTIWMDSLNLWSSFSQRISTIYLPDRKRPMLPTILSDCLCSLHQNNRRFAFVMDILLDNETNIIDISYSNCIIKVFKNFSYEEPQLFDDYHYNYLLETCKKMFGLYLRKIY